MKIFKVTRVSYPVVYVPEIDPIGKQRYPWITALAAKENGIAPAEIAHVQIMSVTNCGMCADPP